MSESLRQLFEQLDEYITNTILWLLMKRIEWSRKEVQLLASVSQRLADRAQSAANELDYYVERVWTPKLIARRWGRSIPRVDRPMIKLEYPGKYTGIDYDTVLVVNSPLGNNIQISIPSLPFRDIMHTDPRLNNITTDHILAQLHGVKLILPETIRVSSWITIGGSTVVTKEHGKTAILIRPKVYLVRRVWNNAKCVANTNSSACFYPSDGYFAIGGSFYTVSMENVKGGVLAFVQSVLNIEGDQKKISVMLGICNARCFVSISEASGTITAKDDDVGVVCVTVDSDVYLDAAYIMLAESAIPMTSIPGNLTGLVYEKCCYAYRQSGRTVVIPCEAQTLAL